MSNWVTPFFLISENEHVTIYKGCFFFNSRTVLGNVYLPFDFVESNTCFREFQDRQIFLWVPKYRREIILPKSTIEFYTLVDIVLDYNHDVKSVCKAKLGAYEKNKTWRTDWDRQTYTDALIQTCTCGVNSFDILLMG